MKKIMSLVFAVAVLTGFVYAQETTVREITGEEDLVQEKGKFAGTWVNPDADISQYSKLYMWQSAFSFREGGKTSTGTTMQMMRGDQSGPYMVTEDSQEKFKQIVNDAIINELGRGKFFEVVDTVGPDTLLVRAGVLDIVSWVPTNLRADRIHLAAVGEGTIFFELIDAETGVIQARVAERRRIQPQERMNEVSAAPANAATVMNDIEQWARNEARILRKELEKAKKKAN
jgi:hypothetical protein